MCPIRSLLAAFLLLAAALSGPAAGRAGDPDAAGPGQGPAPGAAGRPTATLLFVARTTDLASADGATGFGRLAALVRAERERGWPVLLIHGGDTLSPGALSAFDEGAHQIDLLNTLGVDAFAVQPRDYNYGIDVLSRRAAEATFPLIASNVRDTASDLSIEGVEEAAILPVGPLRVGLLSIIGGDDLVRSSAQRVRMLDAVSTAREKAAALRDAGVDLVLVMSSDRRRLDLELQASAVADVVLSAQRPGAPTGLIAQGPPLLAAPGIQGSHVVALDIYPADPVGNQGSGWRVEGRLLETALLAPDPVMERRVRSYKERLAAQQSEPLLTLIGPADTRIEALRLAENGFANLIADALRISLQADVALLNAGAIRGYRLYPAGHVFTRGELHVELPFRNRALLIEVTGAQLRAALENAVYDAENRSGGVPDGRFPVVSNLRLRVDLSRLPGSRIPQILVGDRPLDPAARYRLATTDFLASGGDGFDVLTSAPLLTRAGEANLLSTVVAAGLARKGRADPKPDGRIQFASAGGVP